MAPDQPPTAPPHVLGSIAAYLIYIHDCPSFLVVVAFYNFIDQDLVLTKPACNLQSRPLPYEDH
eukprot:10708408-Ditylum_brightwellii.AAC.1